MKHCSFTIIHLHTKQTNINGIITTKINRIKIRELWTFIAIQMKTNNIHYILFLFWRSERNNSTNDKKRVDKRNQTNEINIRCFSYQLKHDSDN